MTDCLIIGFNDGNLEDYVHLLKAMGTGSGAYQDLDLALVEYEGRPHRSMDILNRFYFESRGAAGRRPFHNADFLWPVVTYLGTYLARRGFSFDYVNLFHLEKEKLREKLIREDVLTVVVTTTLYVSPNPILEIISFVRRYNRTAKIVVGGPFIAGQPKALSGEHLNGLFKSLGADFYVINSEGEATLAKLLSALKAGSGLGGIENLAYREGDDFRIAPCGRENNSLEANMIDYSLFPAAEIDQFVTTRTAKSCPFACSFCAFPERAGQYTYMSVEAVERELNAIRDIGTVSTVTFIDDTFNVPKARFKEILRMMIRNKYDFKWNCLYRSDHGDEEAIALMGEAGCEGVFLGVESGSDRMLERMNKTARRKHYLKAIPLLRKAGVSTYASLIIGFPGETFETVQETIDLVEEARPDYFRAQLWYADPITPIWNKKDEYGIRGSGFAWSHDTMDVGTACELINRIFLSVENSVWLPQFGFEQWSTFYLQRKGMTDAQIKTFLRCFNAVIKDRLLAPGREGIDPPLLENLKRSCQFDRGPRPSEEVLEPYSGASYLAAERFWIDQASDELSASPLEPLAEGPARGAVATASFSFLIGDEALGAARSELRAADSEIILAAYALALARLGGRDAMMMIVSSAAAEGRTITAPLKLDLRGCPTFAEFVERLRRTARESSDLRRFAFHVLTSGAALGAHGRVRPALDVAYSYEESVAPAEDAMLERALSRHPTVSDGLRLHLRARRAAGGVGLELFYRPESLRERTAETIAARLLSVLGQVGADPQVSLSGVALGAEESDDYQTVSADAGEVFNF
ncbi:MAG TPA: PhpK family radical SAM P-methyltransferase [Pyrinomonadaceae bacterium]|jgi:radical SAM PhpK family P-methyltransferase